MKNLSLPSISRNPIGLNDRLVHPPTHALILKPQETIRLPP